ncbi:PaaI family thioesterase [Corynebacterium occultum]|nr:PaaI family thioesterase [Corynebacterium occultum]
MKLLELAALAATRDLDSEELTKLNGHRSGADAALGIHYTRVGPEGVAAELRVGGHLLQPVGLVHGGMYAALAESLGSLAGLVHAGGNPVVGVNNNTDLISSVRSGVITAVAEPIQLGRNTQLLQINMHHEDTLVARTTLRTMVLRR